MVARRLGLSYAGAGRCAFAPWKPPDFVGHQEGTVPSQVAGVNKVAHAREGGWSTDLPRFHLREDVTRADES